MVSAPEYPFESHYLDRDGIRYHYLDEGQGETVVLVHGNPTWSFYYRRLIAALRPHYRTIAPDHIGCGLSDKPGDDRYRYTLASRVDDLERLLDHLGLTHDLTLVLHDWGGMVGMAFADRHPQRIRRLVLLNTGAFHLPRDKGFPPALRIGRDTWIGALLIRGGNAFCRVAARVCCKRKPLSRAVRNAYLAPYNSWSNRIAVLRFVQDIPLRPGDRAYDLVSKVQNGLFRFKATPTLICWGMRDFVFSHHFLDAWNEYLPQAEVHRFEDCGHYILEDAAEEIVPLVLDFLTRHPLDTIG